MKEVEAYTLFTPNKNIIHSVDYCVSTESGSKLRSDGGDAGSKTVYILLPYYQRGNLQDAINANLVNHTNFPEKKLVVLILGVAKALKSMHHYRVRSNATSAKKAKMVRREGEEADREAAQARGKPKMLRRPTRRGDDDDDDTEQEPLMDGEVTISQEGVEEGGYRPYAHRDIKPGMLRRIKQTDHLG